MTIRWSQSGRGVVRAGGHALKPGTEPHWDQPNRDTPLMRAWAEKEGCVLIQPEPQGLLYTQPPPTHHPPVWWEGPVKGQGLPCNCT